jgi:hypothetical protein
MSQFLITWLTILFVVVTIFSSVMGDPGGYLAIADTAIYSTSVRGGGTGTITCPVGSSLETNLSFVAVSSHNGTLIGNWTLYSFDSNGPGDVVQGVLYRGNTSLSGYEIEGETVDQQDRIMICDPPLFGPITISGACGRDVDIMIGFQTDDPFDVAEEFSGSVDCQNTNVK